MSPTSPRNGSTALCFLALLTISNLSIVGCSFNVSTAKIDNLKICSTKNQDKECAVDTNSFTKTTPKLFATVDLNNALDGTKVKVDWKYLGGEAGSEQVLDSVNLEAESNMSLITSDLTAGGKNWPIGNYEVVFTLETDNSKPLKKQFLITK
jgi:hypothetical protein